MVNCGRCGRPVFEASQPLCKGCRNILTTDHGKYAERENRKAELKDQLYDSMSDEGKEDDKYDLDFWGLSEKDRDYKKKGRGR